MMRIGMDTLFGPVYAGPPTRRSALGALSFVMIALLAACGGEVVVEPERYAAIDSAVEQIKENVAGSDVFNEVADIDHSRLAHEADSPMPPARVLIFSDPELETQLIRMNPLTALELPLRVLAFESEVGADASITYNSFDYLVSRYQLDLQESDSLRERYDRDIALVSSGLSKEAMYSFATDEMQPDGIITIESPFAFEETLQRVNTAIDAQDDTVHFGVVDFQANARALGQTIPRSHMILFGGPGPGGKAMANASTLGLDGFCQKFLIWQDPQGRTFLSFNDLLALADRQGVSKSLALRVINFRLHRTFSEALTKG